MSFLDILGLASSDDEEEDRRKAVEKKTAARKKKKKKRSEEKRETDVLGRAVCCDFVECEDGLKPREFEKRKFIARVLETRGFRFELLEHQFDGALFVGGLVIHEIVENSMRLTLEKGVSFSSARSAIFSDEMGLGKTVQTLAACELRKAVLEAKGLPVLRTLIICPSDGVLDQWISHIEGDGRDEGSLIEERERCVVLSGSMRGLMLKQARKNYVLITRYQLQEEMTSVASKVTANGKKTRNHYLFPGTPPSLLAAIPALHDKEMAPIKRYNDMQHLPEDDDQDDHNASQDDDLEECSATRRHQNESSSTKDERTRLLKLLKEAFPAEDREKNAFFDLVVVDEAHLMKNALAWWSIAAALCGHASRRFVAVTGTPFCNRLEDVASIAGLGDARNAAADVAFLHKAFRGTDPRHRAAFESWKRDCYLARYKSLVLQLPAKHEQVLSIPFVKTLFDDDDDETKPAGAKADCEDIVAKNESLQSGEFKVYAALEASMLRAVQDWRRAASKLLRRPQNRRLRAECRQQFVKFLGFAQLARGATIHPALPGDGRTLTSMLLGRSIAKGNRRCVYCRKGDALSLRAADIITKTVTDLKEKKKSNKKKRRRRSSSSDDDDNTEPEADEDDEDDEDDEGKRARRKTKETEEFKVELPRPQCALRHWAHVDCARETGFSVDSFGVAAKYEDSSSDDKGPLRCPLCVDLRERTKLGSHASSEAPRRVYCKDKLWGGFAASGKIERLVDLIREVCLEKEEKIIVYSCLKGALDLAQLCLTDVLEHPDFAFKCARYDGDVKATDRARVLADFRGDPKVKVLLATPACCGLGLNITCANHVAFLDRSWNPTTQSQAMDRCHRIGQSKEVTVYFFDADLTFDDVMRAINLQKLANSKVVFADGTAFAVGRPSTSNSFDDTIGIFPLFKDLVAKRHRRMGLDNVYQAAANAPAAAGTEDENVYIWREKVNDDARLVREAENIHHQETKSQEELDREIFLLAATALANARDDDDDDVAPFTDHGSLPDEDTWICPVCAGESAYDDTNCDMCGTLNPALAPLDDSAGTTSFFATQQHHHNISSNGASGSFY